MKKRIHQFTLVELMLVIMLIAALSGIAFGITSYVHRKSDEIKMTGLLNQIKILNEQYKSKYGFYCPPVDGKLDDEYSQVPFNASFLKDAYETVKNINRSQSTSAVVLDIWGNPVRYRVPGKFNTGTFDLYSVGPDGSPGILDEKTNKNNSWNQAGKGDDIAIFTNNKK